MSGRKWLGLVWTVALVTATSMVAACETAPVERVIVATAASQTVIAGTASDGPPVIVSTEVPTATASPILLSDLQAATATPPPAVSRSQMQAVAPAPVAVATADEQTGSTALPSSTPTPAMTSTKIRLN